MEGQITIAEWIQWKEDIRKKLQETAGNFVYIGYRLKQIRDSGMYGDAKDIFEFAQNEYGLGRSMVQRFIAINEKFSKDGNSLELREEYATLGSSKLTEMLTLTASECSLITEHNTVKEIRDYKEFTRQQEPDHVIEIGGDGEKIYSPLQKCIIDFFKAKEKREVLNKVLTILRGNFLDREDEKKIAEIINPGESATHKKGIIYLFLYNHERGIAYKSMQIDEPVKMTWLEFGKEIYSIYEENLTYSSDAWVDFYGEPEPDPEPVVKEMAKVERPSGIAPPKQTEKPKKEESLDDEGEEEEDENEEEGVETKEQEDLETHTEPERLTKGQERIRSVFEGESNDETKDSKEDEEKLEEDQEDPEEDGEDTAENEENVAAGVEPSHSVNTESEHCATSHKNEPEALSGTVVDLIKIDITKDNVSQSIFEIERLVNKAIFKDKKQIVKVMIELEDEE